jgi:hypothetical protein
VHQDDDLRPGRREGLRHDLGDLSAAIGVGQIVSATRECQDQVRIDVLGVQPLGLLIFFPAEF